jgi:hypothetical protein
MSFYDYNLFAFVCLISVVGYYQYNREAASSRSREDDDGESGKEASATAKAVNWQFKKRFLPVYLLVYGADWLQVSRCIRLYRKGMC